MNAPESRQNAFQEPQQSCKGCEGLFRPKRRWQAFCSDQCRGEFHRRQRLGPDGRIGELEKKVEELRAGQDDLARRVAALEALPKP